MPAAASFFPASSTHTRIPSSPAIAPMNSNCARRARPMPKSRRVAAATADHLERTTDEGLAALHAAGVQPVLLPGAVYQLGSAHYPNARRMLELGMPVVLATDFNPGTSPTTSMPMILSLACTHMKMT